MFLIKPSLSFGEVDNFAGPEIVDIVVTCTGKAAVVRVTGELDLSNSGWLHQCLHDAIDAGVLDVVVDVEHLTYMDSTGLRVIEAAQKRMRAAGGTLTVVSPMPIVEKLFHVTRAACA